MRCGRPPKAPVYVLPHGIEVIGEYPPKGNNAYWRVRIRPHQFFHHVVLRCGGIYVRRSRVILASKLGRALTCEEHAHHCNEDKVDDAGSNVEPISPAEHNRHHKTGTRHTETSKQQLRESMKRAYAEGRHERFAIATRDTQGRIAS